MAEIQSLTRACGSNVPPGIQLTAWFTLAGELAAWPETREEGGGTAQGDSKILDEPFSFTGAPVGKGFWRKLNILTDTGNVRDTLEGEIGGQGFVNRLEFFVLGASAAQREFADLVAANAGCLVFMVKTKSGEHVVIGNKDNPCFVEASEMALGAANGDRVGTSYTLYANTGYTCPIYDAAEHGIDETPNT